MHGRGLTAEPSYAESQEKERGCIFSFSFMNFDHLILNFKFKMVLKTFSHSTKTS
jgi:hypothetical protein